MTLEPGGATIRRPQHAAFVFQDATLAGRTIVLRYQLAGGPDPDISFEERLALPHALPEPDATDPTVQRLLGGIHRAYGISYFKAAVPRQMVATPVPEVDARFWDTLYTEGLGEFYYRNAIDPRGLVTFPRGGSAAPPCPAQRPGDGALVLVGGGKDSIVAREVVGRLGGRVDALSLGMAPWVARSAAAMNLRHLTILRQIDPRLFDLNKAGAWNGHIPISACIAFVSILVAYAGGYEAVVAGNERSADQGNVEWNGLAVNHQWSKSLGFEAQFQDWCDRQFRRGPVYFSILRPLSELRIAEAFAGLPQYFDAFSSCNGNFKQKASAEPPRWCGHCPKCVFVQLALAPSLDEAGLLRIFGGDFLADPANLPLLESLAGLVGSKPFECVGTAEETRAALARLALHNRLAPGLATWYKAKLAHQRVDPAAAWEHFRVPEGPHRIPARWEAALHDYLGSSRR